MPDDLVRRRALLTTALVAAQSPESVPEARMLRAWLDTWAGVGHVVTGMNCKGYDARLSQSVFGWRAEFCRKQVNPAPKWEGQASAVGPQRAVQYAAPDTLERTEASET